MSVITEAVKLLHAALEENHNKQFKLQMKREKLIEDEEAIKNAIATLVPDEKEEEKIITKKQKRAGWKKGTLEASIVSAMMTDPNNEWTIRDIQEMINRPPTSIHRKMCQSDMFIAVRKGKGRRQSLWKIRTDYQSLPFGERNTVVHAGNEVR